MEQTINTTREQTGFTRFTRGVWLTFSTLFGGLIIGIVAGDILFKILPGSSLENPAIGHMAIAAMPAFAGFLAGGYAWGRAMGNLAGASNLKRLGWAGMLGFAPITILLAVGLSVAEPPLVENYSGIVPIHRIFMLMFVPTAFLIPGVSAWAIGKGMKDNKLARRLLWQVGGAGGLAFFAVNLVMELSGWVVGAPGAAQRATMITVAGLGILATTIAGGGVIGMVLSGYRDE